MQTQVVRQEITCQFEGKWAKRVQLPGRPLGFLKRKCLNKEAQAIAAALATSQAGKRTFLISYSLYWPVKRDEDRVDYTDVNPKYRPIFEAILLLAPGASAFRLVELSEEGQRKVFGVAYDNAGKLLVHRFVNPGQAEMLLEGNESFPYHLFEAGETNFTYHWDRLKSLLHFKYPSSAKKARILAAFNHLLHSTEVRGNTHEAPAFVMSAKQRETLSSVKSIQAGVKAISQQGIEDLPAAYQAVSEMAQATHYFFSPRKFLRALNTFNTMTYTLKSVLQLKSSDALLKWHKRLASSHNFLSLYGFLGTVPNGRVLGEAFSARLNNKFAYGSNQEIEQTVQDSLVRLQKVLVDFKEALEACLEERGIQFEPIHASKKQYKTLTDKWFGSNKKALMDWVLVSEKVTDRPLRVEPKPRRHFFRWNGRRNNQVAPVNFSPLPTAVIPHPESAKLLDTPTSYSNIVSKFGL